MPSISFVIPRSTRRTLEHLPCVDPYLPGVEIVIADAGSTDGTLEVIERYGVDQVVDNPLQTGESGKAAGMRARGEVLAFVDPDNVLVGTDWLRRMTRRSTTRRSCTEALRWEYAPHYSLVDRYCAHRRERPRLDLRRQLRPLLLPHPSLDGLSRRAGAARRVHPRSSRSRTRCQQWAPTATSSGLSRSGRSSRAITSSTSTRWETRPPRLRRRRERRRPDRPPLLADVPGLRAEDPPAGATSSTTAAAANAATRGNATAAGLGLFVVSTVATVPLLVQSAIGYAARATALGGSIRSLAGPRSRSTAGRSCEHGSSRSG